MADCLFKHLWQSYSKSLLVYTYSREDLSAFVVLRCLRGSVINIHISCVGISRSFPYKYFIFTMNGSYIENTTLFMYSTWQNAVLCGYQTSIPQTNTLWCFATLSNYTHRGEGYFPCGICLGYLSDHVLYVCLSSCYEMLSFALISFSYHRSFQIHQVNLIWGIEE